MSNPRCETCRFLDGRDEQEQLGICCRYPPVYEGDDDSSDCITDQYCQPFVSYGNWCGEHTPRKPLPVVEQSGGKLHFHVSGDNVWRADAGTYSFQIAKEGEEHYTAMMYGYDPVAWGSYETAVAWCETMLRNHGN